MTSALLVAVVLLAIVTAGNIFLLLAVIRRLRQMQDLVAPPAPVPDVGTVVEPFYADTVAGGRLSTDDFTADPVLVALLSSTCPACHGMATALQAMATSAHAPMVLVVAEPDHDNSAMLQALSGLGRVAVIERDHPALAAFGGMIGAFPTVMAIRDGVVVSASTELEDVLPALKSASRLAAR